MYTVKIQMVQPALKQVKPVPSALMMNNTTERESSAQDMQSRNTRHRGLQSVLQ